MLTSRNDLALIRLSICPVPRTKNLPSIDAQPFYPPFHTWGSSWRPHSPLQQASFCTEQSCGSGMFISDTRSWLLSIPHPGSRIQQQKQKEKWENILNGYGKKLSQLTKNCRYFVPKKLSISSQKYGFGIRDPEKTYSGFRGQNVTQIPVSGVKKGTRSRIQICNPGTEYLFYHLGHTKNAWNSGFYFKHTKNVVNRREIKIQMTMNINNY